MKKHTLKIIKNIILIFLCVVIVGLTLNSCGLSSGISGLIFYGIPMNWSKVEIEDHGTIRLPEGWKVSNVEGFMYISSNESEANKYVLIQSYDNMEMNTYFSGIEDKEFIRDINFSNSTSVTKYKIFYEDGIFDEMLCLCLDDALYFYCVDKTISQKTLEKIAQSFEPCD